MSEREREILEAAAVLFAERGYAATSVRDIGERVGLLGGSLYHYIKSKEALFVKVHDVALQTAEDRIRDAIDKAEGPWERLETACVTFLEIQLDPNSITMPLMSDFQSVATNLSRCSGAAFATPPPASRRPCRGSGTSEGTPCA